MKKSLIKNNLLIFSPLTLIPFALISCQQNSPKSNEFNFEEKKINVNQDKIDNLLNIFFKDKNSLKNDYKSEQNLLKNEKLFELKYALSYYKFNRPNASLNRANDIKQISKKIIFNNLSSNWYWFLNNITHAEYYLNPYKNDRYVSYLEESDDFSNNKKLLRLNKIINIEKLAIPKNDDSFYDRGEIFYIEFDNKTFIKLFSFSKDNKEYIRVDADVFEIKDNLNFKDVIKEFHQAFYDIKKQSKQEDIDEAKEEYADDEERIKKEIRKINLQYSEENEFNFMENSLYQNLNQKVYNKLKSKITRYTLQNINSKIIENFSIFDRNNNFITNDITSKNEKFNKYIDKDKDVIVQNYLPDQKITDEIINSLLNEVYSSDQKSIDIFKLQQDDPEYQKTILSKMNELINDSTKIDEYKKLLSENWYLVLKNLTKFEAKYLSLFKFPEQTNPITKEKVSHSKEYLDDIERKENFIKRAHTSTFLSTPYNDIHFLDNFIYKKEEADASKMDGNGHDYYILKNNVLFNVKIILDNKGNQVVFNPYILYFANNRAKSISIDAITTIFHQALFHQEQSYYYSFEKEIVEELRYGIPAKMLLKPREVEVK